MKRRTFLQQAGMGAAGTLGTSSTVNSSMYLKSQPDIVLVMADDMGWMDCGPYGNPDVQTPNLDSLAKQGITFDAMFTSTAMCSPCRQQLYTGLYPVRNGAYPQGSMIYDGVKTLPVYLTELGYRVGIFGKQHYAPQESYPFEVLDSSDENSIRRFIYRDQMQPYCIIVTSHQPHLPFDQGDPSPYDAKKIKVSPHLVDCEETRKQLVKYYAEISYLDEELGKCMDIIDTHPHCDMTAVIFTSEQGSYFPFGKWTCYDAGLKTAFVARLPLYIQEGIRTSAMTQYIDILPTLIELAGGDPETIHTGIADTNGFTGFDGKSFLPVLKGESGHHRDYVYGVQTTRGIRNSSEAYPVRSIRSPNYKYIKNLNHTEPFYNNLTVEERTNKSEIWYSWLDEGKTDPKAHERAMLYKFRPAEELYDVRNDPFELTNLAGDESLSSVKQDLDHRLTAWMKQQGDEGMATEWKAKERQPNAGGKGKQPYQPPGE